MDVLDCIRTRRSIRKYKDIHVEWDKMGQVLDAARHAPTSGNIQNWKIIVVLTDEQREKVANACLQQFWIGTAPVVLVVCAEPRKAQQFYGIRGDRLYSIQNCASVVENMLLAAHALGLGACWIGAFDEEMLKRSCAIPDYVRPQAVVTLGYPDEEPLMPPHFKLTDLVYFRGYDAKIYDIPRYVKDYGVVWEREGKRMAKQMSKKMAPLKKKMQDRYQEISQKIKEKMGF